MKKPALILLAIVVVAVAVHFLCYHAATGDTRRMLKAEDNMAWLRMEFMLNDEQARSIAALEAEYEPRCAAMCERIAESNKRLEKLLATSKTMTPELEAALRDASQTQADCRAATMKQVFAISAHMAPEQAVRYRAMIAARVMPHALGHDTPVHH
ncbi:MAG: hypothetical protein RL088_631 [Verrucomicrobiota bacterium]|jgi:anion-transporting  ArsA/GET3 family ATPase